MNKIECVEFILERMRDGKEFLVEGYEMEAFYNNNDGNFYWVEPTSRGKIYMKFNEMLYLDLQLPPAHSFTPDELVIMEHLPYPYLVRDFDGELWNYEYEPFKMEEHWEADGGFESSRSLHLFEHMFESIEFENKEPVNRKDYL